MFPTENRKALINKGKLQNAGSKQTWVINKRKRADFLSFFYNGLQFGEIHAVPDVLDITVHKVFDENIVSGYLKTNLVLSQFQI